MRRVVSGYDIEIPVPDRVPQLLLVFTRAKRWIATQYTPLTNEMVLREQQVLGTSLDRYICASCLGSANRTYSGRRTMVRNVDPCACPFRKRDGSVDRLNSANFRSGDGMSTRIRPIHRLQP